jgi:hypothetical protein
MPVEVNGHLLESEAVEPLSEHPKLLGEYILTSKRCQTFYIEFQVSGSKFQVRKVKLT